MNDQPILITKLESKIEDLHRDWKNAQAIINRNPTSIQEYIKLKEDTSIEIGIRYVSLEAIAEEYDLYRDDREISELKDLISREIDVPSHADVLQSVQTLRDRYRKVYECNGRKFDRYERLAQDNLRKKDMRTKLNEDLDKKSIPNKVIIDRSTIIIAVRSSVAIAFLLGFTILGYKFQNGLSALDTAIKEHCDGSFTLFTINFQCKQHSRSIANSGNSRNEANNYLPPITTFKINDREDLFPIEKYKIDNPSLGEAFDLFYDANIKNKIKVKSQQSVILYIYGSADSAGKNTFIGYRSSTEDLNMCNGNFNKATIRKKEEKSDRYQDILTEIDLNKSSFRNEDLPNLRARWFQCWIGQRYPELKTEIREGIVDDRFGEKFRSVRVSISD